MVNSRKGGELTCLSVLATRLSSTGPRSSCSRWTSSKMRRRTIWDRPTSPTLFLVTTSHFSGVVTNIWKQILKESELCKNTVISYIEYLSSPTNTQNVDKFILPCCGVAEGNESEKLLQSELHLLISPVTGCILLNIWLHGIQSLKIFYCTHCFELLTNISIAIFSHLHLLTSVMEWLLALVTAKIHFWHCFSWLGQMLLTIQLLSVLADCEETVTTTHKMGSY